MRNTLGRKQCVGKEIQAGSRAGNCKEFRVADIGGWNSLDRKSSWGEALKWVGHILCDSRDSSALKVAIVGILQ